MVSFGFKQSWEPKYAQKNPPRMKDSRLETKGLAAKLRPMGAEFAAMAAAMGDLHMQWCNGTSVLIRVLSTCEKWCK